CPDHRRDRRDRGGCREPPAGLSAPTVDILGEGWNRAMTTQPAPPDRVVALTAVLAVLLVWAPGAWPVTRHVVTIAHEAAHGFAALLSGRRLHGIRLHSDTSRLAVAAGRTHASR